MVFEDDSEPPILTVRAAVQDIAFGSVRPFYPESLDSRVQSGQRTEYIELMYHS